MTTKESSHLRAAILDLKKRRDEIDSALSKMESVLSLVYGEPLDRAPSGSFQNGTATAEVREIDVIPAIAVTAGGGNRSENVRKLFYSNPDKVWDAPTLLAAIGEDSTPGTLKSVHAIISRLKEAGVVVRVGHGRHRLAPTDTSTPSGELGVEVTGESSEDSPQQEGADHGSAPSEDRAVSAGLPHWDHGLTGRRTSVMEVR